MKDRIELIRKSAELEVKTNGPITDALDILFLLSEIDLLKEVIIFKEAEIEVLRSCKREMDRGCSSCGVCKECLKREIDNLHTVNSTLMEAVKQKLEYMHDAECCDGGSYESTTFKCDCGYDELKQAYEKAIANENI